MRKNQKKLDHALFDAAEQGDEAGVKKALSEGANPNAREGGDPDYSPLCAALIHGFEEGKEGGLGVLSALLAAGADAAQPSGDDQYSPWESAAMFEAPPAAVSLMIKAGAKVGSVDERGATALHHAADEGQWEKALLLMEAGEDPLALDENGLSPAQRAKAAGRRKTAGAIEAFAEARALSGETQPGSARAPAARL